MAGESTWEDFVPGRILCRKDFVPGGFCTGRILYWEDFVPGGFCTWEDFVPGGKRAVSDQKYLLRNLNKCLLPPAETPPFPSCTSAQTSTTTDISPMAIPPMWLRRYRALNTVQLKTSTMGMEKQSRSWKKRK